MKKISTLTFLLMIATISFAQLINPGFESWTKGIPDGWSTSKTIDSTLNLETKDSVNVHSGNASIRIMTGYAGRVITMDSLAGFVHYGPLHYDLSRDIETVDNFNAYIPCTPDSIKFSYKYTSVGGDQGSVNVYLSGEVIDGYPLAATSTWQTMTLGFFSLGPSRDSISLTFFSSFDLNVNHPPYHAGSTLWVDDVSFIYNNGGASCLNGVNDISSGLPMHVYPNPATNQITLAVMPEEIGSEVQITDRIGRIVYEGTVDKTDYVISTGKMESGYYVVRTIREGLMTHCTPLTILK